MARTAQRMREFRGPAILSGGYRPLFLFAALWSALAMALWVLSLAGTIVLPGAYAPVDWHAHELLYGYLFAVIAGFMLTAIPNWTGRLPVTGWPLLALVGLWLVGRAGLLASAWIGLVPAAVLDMAFGVALCFVAAREILAGRNWRNLKIVALIGVMAIGNALFHLEAAVQGVAVGGYGMRLGLGVAILLISVIGGRIVPSFTRNWLAKSGQSRLPAPPERLDSVILALTAAGLVFWLVIPTGRFVGLVFLGLGALHAARLARWAGVRTWREPLVLILHLGYAFVPIGFLLIGLGQLRPGMWSASAALHAWLAGAIGIMTLAVMTRASLGHSGRTLTAGPAITAIYALVILSVVSRLAADLWPGEPGLLHVAGGAWIAAFAGFAIVFAPLLTQPRRAST